MFDGLYGSSARQSLRHAQNGSISPALKSRDAIALEREVAAQMSDEEIATAQRLDHVARSRRKRAGSGHKTMRSVACAAERLELANSGNRADLEPTR